MIPRKKKSPEELAALREELGIPEAFPESENQTNEKSPQKAVSNTQQAHGAEQTTNHARPEESLESQAAEPFIHLGVPAAQAPKKPRTPVKNRSLRRYELPLAPPPETTGKTALPTHRRSPAEIAESKRREALAILSAGPVDPVAYLRKITAHPALLTPAYLCVFGAAVAAWQRAQYFTPLALVAIAALLAIWIFIAKKRSRHHSAILIIIIIMTVAFGGLHYAPLIFYAP